jgi:ABC-type proline/glycine betaine transport system permease subunit
MDDERRAIVIAIGEGVASSAREVVARVVLPLLDFPKALNDQLIPLVRQ